MSDSTGTDLIAAERARQVAKEGYRPAHDAAHGNGALALAAACYATPPALRQHRKLLTSGGYERPSREPQSWPWAPLDWKPTPDDRVRELVKAGALIAAEIDRLLARRAPDGERDE